MNTENLKHFVAAAALSCVAAVVPLHAQESLPNSEPKLPTLRDSLPTFGHHGDIVYGSADAPITVIEYASMTCNHCGAFARDIFPRIKEKYIDSGRVRFVFRNFLLNQADLAIAMITRCGDEAQAKAMVSKYYELQDTWLQSPDARLAILSIAQGFGFDEAGVNQCMRNPVLQETLISGMQAADTKYKIQGTPTIIVNEKKLNTYAWEVVDIAIAEAFAKSLTEGL